MQLARNSDEETVLAKEPTNLSESFKIVGHSNSLSPEKSKHTADDESKNAPSHDGTFTVSKESTGDEFSSENSAPNRAEAETADAEMFRLKKSFEKRQIRMSDETISAIGHCQVQTCILIIFCQSDAENLISGSWVPGRLLAQPEPK